VADSTWLKRIHVPETYTGPITIYLFAPLFLGFDAQGAVYFDSSVTDCLSLADNEMGGEFCGAHGQPWTVTITDAKQTIALTAFPAFGMATSGQTVVLMEDLYSPQLNNSRNVSVFIPPSLLQNKMQRPVNIMILLDGAHSVVESFAARTGFETLQVSGVVPESIMIGVTTVEFAYAGRDRHVGNEAIMCIMRYAATTFMIWPHCNHPPGSLSDDPHSLYLLALLQATSTSAPTS
jgi:hypothetical protein